MTWKAVISYRSSLYADGATLGFDQETADPTLEVAVRGRCVTLKSDDPASLLHPVNKRTGRDLQLDRATKIEFKPEG